MATRRRTARRVFRRRPKPYKNWKPLTKIKLNAPYLAGAMLIGTALTIWGKMPKEITSVIEENNPFDKTSNGGTDA